MKKRLAIAILALVILLAGCNTTPVTKVGDKQEQEEQYSMFVEIERASSWRVVYHRETKVMYVVSNGSYNSGSFTVLVDENGWPLLWEDGK